MVNSSEKLKHGVVRRVGVRTRSMLTVLLLLAGLESTDHTSHHLFYFCTDTQRRCRSGLEMAAVPAGHPAHVRFFTI